MPRLTPPAMALGELLAGHTAPAADPLIRREADGVLRCLACGHRCRVLPGRAGVCRVRFERDGTLRVPHGYVAGLAVDPIEKKPFFHVLPGRNALSFGMLGCDLHCAYCQNWVTSQALRDDEAVTAPTFITPAEIVRLAQQHGCPLLTSTYNEPLITAEWAVEIFRAGRPAGLRGSFVSNGHGTPEALAYLRPHVDCYKIDLKAFRDASYRRLGGVLENVLATVRRAWELGFWVEVVTLVVPGLNDEEAELRDIAEFLAGVSPEIPWHVTAFHPDYRMTELPRTTVEGVLRAHAVGRAAGLHYVYAGNLPGYVGACEDTHCPDCRRAVIRRRGFKVLANELHAGCCPECGRALAGVWQ